jgi:hypothetical protein
VLLQGATRENILHGSLSDEQRSSSAKDRATLRAELWRAAGGVAPHSQSAAAMLFRRALPVTRQNSAHQSLFMRWVGFVEKLTNTATVQSAVRRDLSIGS